MLDFFYYFSSSYVVCKSNLSTIPNLPRSGIVRDPTFVVTTIKVNLGKSILIDFAVGHFTIIISEEKLSKTRCNISSTVLFNI